MKTKIQTPFGYLCLSEEQMSENTATAYDKISKHRDIDIIQIISDDSKKLYRTVNPFGVGYTDCFDCILTSHHSRIKLTAGKPEHKIDFIEIS